MNAQRPGARIAIAAVALATAALWIAFGLHYESQRQLQVLIDSVGGNVFYVFHESHEHFSREDLASVRSLLPDAEAIGVAGTGRVVSPDEDYSLTYVEAMTGHFDFFRFRFRYGTAFTATAEREAVLGFEVSEALYGDEDPVGHLFEGFTIVGVLEEVAPDDTVRRPANSQVFVPLGQSPASRASSRNAPYWAIYIRSDLPMEQAVGSLRTLYPDIQYTPTSKRYALVFQTEQMTNRILIISAVGMLLLAGTAVAGTAALSAISRRREMGIRMAIGARPTDAFRELLKDGLWMSFRASIFGILAGLAIQGVGQFLEVQLVLGPLHLAILPSTMLCGFLASLYPSWHTALMQPVHALRERDAGKGRRTRFDAGSVLIAATLLVSTASVLTFLSVGSSILLNIQQIWGNLDRQLLVVSSPNQSFRTPPMLTYADRTAIEALPGVDAVVPSANVLFETSALASRYLMLRGVDEGYEELQILTIVAGRNLSLDDLADGSQVAIVSEAFGEMAFEDGLVLEKSFRVEARAYRIVGVFAADAMHSLTRSQVVVPYRSLPQADREMASHDFFVHISDSADFISVKESISASLRGIYPGKAKVDVINPAEANDSVMRRVLALMARLMVLAGFGIFMSLANAITHIRYDLALQARAISIRKAVGAADWDILKLGVSSALIPGIPAILGALLLGQFTTPLLRNYLGQSDGQSHWAMLALTVGIMVCIAFASGVLAAWRSARISPVEGIRKGRT